MTGDSINRLARVQRGLIIALVAGIGLTAVMGAMMVVADASERVAVVTVGTLSVITVCLGLLVAFAAVLRREQRAPVRIAMIGGAIIGPVSGFLILLIVLEPVIDNDAIELLPRIGGAGLGLSFALAYTGAMAQARSPSWLVRSMAVAATICVWCAFVLAMAFMVIDDSPNDFGTAIAIVLAFLIFDLIVIVGAVAVPIAIVSKAGKRQQPTESIDPRVQVQLGCPKCGERQTHRPGFVKCVGCGVGMFIEIEEPRCECGYLLYRLTSNACPECGRAVNRAG